MQARGAAGAFNKKCIQECGVGDLRCHMQQLLAFKVGKALSLTLVTPSSSALTSTSCFSTSSCLQEVKEQSCTKVIKKEAQLARLHMHYKQKVMIGVQLALLCLLCLQK